MARAKFPWQKGKPTSIGELMEETSRSVAKAPPRMAKKLLSDKQMAKTAPLDPTYLMRPSDEITGDKLMKQRPGSRYGRRGKSDI